MSENISKISRREFLKLLALTGGAALVASCAPKAFEQQRPEENLSGSSSLDKKTSTAIDKLENSLREVESVLGGDDVSIAISSNFPSIEDLAKEYKVQITYGPREERVIELPASLSQLVKDNLDPSLASVIALGSPPALLEPTPIGETALLVLLGTASAIAVAKSSTEVLRLIELNKHTIERRGPELAEYIKTIVEAAFLQPNSPLPKEIICLAAAGIIEGCTHALYLAVEVESRTVPGAKRVASIIFGLTEQGEVKQITALYKSGNLEGYRQGILKRLEKMGLQASVLNSCGPFPPVDKLLAGP
ncbi:MAG: hypothetical protein KatS3mg088_710 [Patescibacteria group bacterium]|nr:MAG: hypothetical protein KatS3mg088_710 [Patescibacteria group bacterium]